MYDEPVDQSSNSCLSLCWCCCWSLISSIFQHQKLSFKEIALGMFSSGKESPWQCMEWDQNEDSKIIYFWSCTWYYHCLNHITVNDICVVVLENECKTMFSRNIQWSCLLHCCENWCNQKPKIKCSIEWNSNTLHAPVRPLYLENARVENFSPGETFIVFSVCNCKIPMEHQPIYLL